MHHVLIGTAGHIDHGKTTLIKALTGIDADRLREEKKRGITIDLGFAYFDLPSGRRAGIVDVPGHERFIKNMLAGIGGIDIVLLVVAADEGVMPQTKEHLDILSLLGIQKGIIILSKIDLVDQEMLQLAYKEIHENLQNTFLENAPILPVSAIEGKGLQELVRLVDDLTESMEERNTNAPFRLLIDRVFSIAGFGTTVTGTQIEGTLREGEELMIYPQEINTRVRSLQVHGENVKTTYAGQRVAVNLSGIKKEGVYRGDVLAKPESLQTSVSLAVKISLLPNTQRNLRNNSRLRLYYGAGEFFCRTIFLDREELKPGQSCYARLKLENKVASKTGDRFILRFYSPMETVGGGVILDPNPSEWKRAKKDVIKELKIMEEGSIETILEQMIEKFSMQFETIKFFALQIRRGEEETNALVEILASENRIIKLSDGVVIHRLYYEKIKENILDILRTYHKANPLKPGMNKEELRRRVLPQAKIKIYDEMLEQLVNGQKVKLEKNHTIAMKSFEISYTGEKLKIKNDLEKIFISNKFNPPTIKEILGQAGKKNKEYREVLQSLIESGQLIKISEDILFDSKNYHEAIQILKKDFGKNREFTIAQFRDRLNTSRKYALPLLEYLDQNKITQRVGEKRILL